MNEGKRLRSPLDDSAGVDGTAGADKRARTCAVPANDITIATVNGSNGSGAAQADGAHTAADERETGAEEAAHSEGTPGVLNAQTSALVDAEDGAGDDMEMDSVDGDAAVDTGAGGLRALLGEELQPGVIMFGMVGGMGPRIVEKPTVDHSSRATVAAFWRAYVSDRLIPTYNLSKTANPKLYGCTLEFLLPPSSETRSFVAPSQYKTQKEAKNAAATLAIDAGILEEGRAAREAAGPEPVDAEDDHNSTSINAVSQLHNAYQKFMPIAPPIYQYSIDELNQTHGVTLTVPITDAITQTFTAAPTFRSRHKAATKVALEALETAVEVMEAEYKRRLFNETDGYLSFNGVDPAREAATLNLPSFIQGMAKKYLLAKEPLSFTLTSTGTEPTDPADLVQTGKLYGASLSITLSPADVRTFTSPHKWPSNRHAKAAVICAALKVGIVDAMKEAKRSRGDTSVVVEAWETQPQAKKDKKDKKGQKEEKKEAVVLLLPEPGSVAYEALENMEQATAYLNLCCQQWTKQSAPIQFSYQLDPETKKLGSILTCSVSPNRRETYTVPPEFATKKGAKDAVVRLALRERVLDLVKDGWSAQSSTAATIKVKMEADGSTSLDRAKNKRVKVKKGGRTDGEASMDPTAPVCQPAVRNGDEGTPAPPQYQQNFREQSFAPPPFPPPSDNVYPPQGQFYNGPPQFNQYRPGFAFPQYGGPPPPFGHQPSYYGSPGPGYGHPQQYGGPQMYGGYQAPQMGPPQDAVRYLDDFCQGLMGAGHLPSYEAHQDAQSGLFGAVLRLNITPTNNKSFYVDCGFQSRSESQDAVARIALQDGIEQTIRLEFPPNSSPGPASGQPFPPPPQQQFQHQHQQSPFNSGPTFGQQQQQGYRPFVPPQFDQRQQTPQPFRAGSMAPTNGFHAAMEPPRPILKTESPHTFERKVDRAQRISSPVPSSSTSFLPLNHMPPPLQRALLAIRPSPAVVSSNNHDASSPLSLTRQSSIIDPSILLAIQAKCNIIRGSDIPLRFTYYAGASETPRTVACKLLVPIDDASESVIEFSTEPIWPSKRVAKKAVLELALKEGLYDSFQRRMDDMRRGERERVEEERRAAAEEAMRQAEEMTNFSAREAMQMMQAGAAKRLEVAAEEEKAEASRRLEMQEAARLASAAQITIQAAEALRVEMAEKLAKEQASEAATARDAAARREASKEAAAFEAQERQTIEESSSSTTLVDEPTTKRSREDDTKPDISTRLAPQSRLLFLDSPHPRLTALLEYCIAVGHAPPRFIENGNELVAFVEGYQFQLPGPIQPRMTVRGGMTVVDDPKERLCGSILKHLKKQKQ